MEKFALGARFALGLIFFVFGLNGFLNFIPQPTEMPENIATFMKGMMATGYLFPLIKGTEVVCGFMLLIGRCQSLALVILAPIVINIFMVHAVMDTRGLPMAVFIVICCLVLAKRRWHTFKGLFE